MKTAYENDPKNANRFLKPETKVVSHLDGEPGTILEVCTRRRCGIGAMSYVVQTAYGREIWEVADLFVPAPEQA